MGTRERRSSRASSIASSRDVTEAHEDGKVAMKRGMGLFSGTALMVGTMIGSGIFVSPVGILEQTESVGMSLVIWALCGVLVTIAALCYAELGVLIPRSGGEHSYIYDTYGQAIAFLFAWVSTILIRPSSVAIIALSFAEYVVAPFFPAGECGPPQSILKLFSVVCIILIAMINCYSVPLATAVQNVFTVAKLIALVIIIIVGIIEIAKGNTEYLDPRTSFIGSTPNVAAYGIAFYQGLWAFDGWNQMNYAVEELINPYRNLPLGIKIGIPTVTLLYILVNISYFTVMSPEELLQSKAVAVTFGDRTLGVMAWLMPVSVALSTFGAANGTLFTAGRLTYVTSREGHQLGLLSTVHVRFRTPIASLIFSGILAILMVLPSDFDTLINYFSFCAWLFYGITASTVLYLRYKMPDAPRPIKVNIIFPIIVIIASIYLIIAPIIEDPKLEFLYAFLFVIAGFIFYFPFVYKKWKIPGLDYLTIFIQLLYESSATTYVSPVDEEKEEDNADDISVRSIAGSSVTDRK